MKLDKCTNNQIDNIRNFIIVITFEFKIEFTAPFMLVLLSIHAVKNVKKALDYGQEENLGNYEPKKPWQL